MIHLLLPLLFRFSCWAVVILAGALLKECLGLLAKGIHPTIISDALHRAADKSVEVSAPVP